MLMTLTVFLCHAEVTQVNDMKEVFSYFNNADSKTLAIFDVDMVLLQPTDPAFQMANIRRHGNTAKRILKEIPPEKQMMFLCLMTTSCDSQLIDNNTPQILQQIMQKGVATMALTANLTGSLGSIQNMEQWRINVLKGFGIDFSKTAPHKEPLVFEDLATYRGNYTTYLDGVLFVNGTAVSKGDAFLSFLAKIEDYPQKVIFIDDREDNLKSVESAIKTLDQPIEYIGLHYLEAQNYPSENISEEDFESRWLKLAAEVRNLK